MKKTFKRLLSTVLVLALFVCGVIPVTAVEDEEYLSDLKIIYADDYSEAEEILEDSELEDYILLDANLNDNTGKKGVFLAYKVTTDIEDAITDLAIMQMDGGYREGNYQEMIAQSLAEYKQMSENYLTAIEYFNMAYDAGNYLTELAYRQLNFYNVVTEGIDEIPDFEGELIGDIFYNGITSAELATIFMEGNSHALSNIRSLLAMGVSYNADGKTYLEKVGVEAERYNANKNVYDNENYGEIAPMIAATIVEIHDMFKELSLYESELKYEDEELTALEAKYLTHKSLAELMRGVNYLNGKTLYDFVLGYTLNKDDYTALYPLVAALNEGQLAMTRVAHYYDVVRYSVIIEENSDIEAELAALEEKYSENPFNIYTGVDRTIYKDTFALTSAAYRADAFTESGLSALIFESGAYSAAINAGIIGAVVAFAGIGPHIYSYVQPQKYLKIYNDLLNWLKTDFSNTTLRGGPYHGQAVYEAMNDIFRKTVSDEKVLERAVSEGWGFAEKFNYIGEHKILTDDQQVIEAWRQIDKGLGAKLKADADFQRADELIDDVLDRANAITNAAYAMYALGGILMLISAIKIGIGIHNYYHPEYSDIPTALVDLIETIDGDRYIKYDVVYELEPQNDGSYAAADLNAFSANRWNALYYTKSYEAGKPLLADEFVVSSRNNVPGKGYAPVHRFGEIICFDLNKYNFNDDYSIYLSVKQSEHNKSAVEDVPELIGSIFSPGIIVLASSVGLAAGVGATIGTQKIIEKRKSKSDAEA